MQTLDSVVKIAEFPTLTARIATQARPISTEGAMGVPVRELTFASAADAGRRPSRAMENIKREAAVWMARVQMNTAMATSISNTVPHGDVRIESMTYGRPCVAS